MLPNYGCDWTHTPNFKRLGEKTVTFDNCYAGSLPCMPARRELHTGRYNFLHRSWGPIEPYDDSMPELLKKSGIYTHLVSDHYHYWEAGGATYHTKFNTWEIARGQEGDPWKGEASDPEFPEMEIEWMQKVMPSVRQDVINRKYMQEERSQPQAVTFEMGLQFLQTNKDADNWFLQIETFDPHEPFFTQSKYKDLYPHNYEGKEFDWPPYFFVQESDEVVAHGRCEYAALLSMCDEYLGKVLDFMDANNMWDDTMLIVNTDHGFLLSEHGWWGKGIMPIYDEIVHTPFFLWDPRAKIQGERRNAIVQTVDIAPTLLDLFGVALPEGMDGKPLRETVISDKPVRDEALFGFHGGHVNVFDGRYVYMRAPANRENVPLYEYTLMPTHMRDLFKTEELQELELAEPFRFTKGCRTLKTGASAFQMRNPFTFGTKLYDMQNDPHQENELNDPEVELRMIGALARLLTKLDAPEEQFERLGIPEKGEMTIDELKEQKAKIAKMMDVDIGLDVEWTREAKAEFHALMDMTPEFFKDAILDGLKDFVTGSGARLVTEDLFISFARRTFPPDRAHMAPFLRLSGRSN
jgi:arylsulfatase A-like enzyme